MDWSHIWGTDEESGGSCTVRQVRQYGDGERREAGPLVDGWKMATKGPEE